MDGETGRIRQGEHRSLRSGFRDQHMGAGNVLHAIVRRDSHNPFADNGIKLFGPDGYKLSDDDERSIERRLEKDPKLAKSELIGRARRIDDARGRYVQFAKDTFPEHLRLDGLKVVVDCANGAAYHVAPDALWELGAEVIALGVAPDGLNINDKCGSTHPELMQETVVASGADIGLALDGDADRLIVSDEKGQLVDGDQLMALIALGLHRRGELKGDAVVATVMSNLGLERKLGESGLKLLRTKVGDRYVLEEMRARGCNVGGEQSGHIILADHATTGDGLVAGLQVLAALVEASAPASELLKQFEPLPQLLKNVRFNRRAEPLETDSVRKRIAAAEAELEGRGRLVIRKSGTEPLIRVMAEGDDPALVERVVDDICEAVRTVA